jgi:Holliday junction resolvasome RuvABC endonuclease subunit
MEYNKIVIGIDQSYADTGISIWADKRLKLAKSIKFKKCKNNSDKRLELSNTLEKALKANLNKSKELIVIVERIRLRSDGFVNIDYIKGIGALNGVIVDICNKYGISVYSIDTRAWKSRIVGTTKAKTNNYGFDPKKWPTILYCIKMGYTDYIKESVGPKKKKAVIEKDGERYTYNDNTSDSICIGRVGFEDNLGDLLKLEH